MISENSKKKYNYAVSIVKVLVKNGYTAYFAGGFVRDRILFKGQAEIGDIDIATNAKPETIAQLFTHTIGVGEQFGVMVVVMGQIPFEVATFRSDIGITDGRHPEKVVFTDASEDAKRRDFTINGMFFDPIEERVIDFVGGLKDLENRVIRAIGEPQLRFSEDYLRMLRAIRFAARFDYRIDSTSWDALVHDAPMISRISPERIFAEVDKMITGKNPHVALQLLFDSGLLAVILPEVAALSGVEQPPEFHPEGDVFVHTKLCLDKMAANQNSVLAWSVLLHDIGKPPTMYIAADRVRFNNHDKVGAEMSREVLRRLKASNALIDAVSACVENHMNFMNVTRMRLSTLKKFLSRATIQEELELHFADCMASHGGIENYYFVKEKLSTMEIGVIKPAPFIGGRDLIELGLKPGPLFGEILDTVYDLQLEEKLTGKEDAIIFVKTKWIDSNGQ
jgi:putative nucleotidyltransferase with HDIG domain